MFCWTLMNTWIKWGLFMTSDNTCTENLLSIYASQNILSSLYSILNADTMSCIMAHLRAGLEIYIGYVIWIYYLSLFTVIILQKCSIFWKTFSYERALYKITSNPVISYSKHWIFKFLALISHISSAWGSQHGTA